MAYMCLSKNYLVQWHPLWCLVSIVQTPPLIPIVYLSKKNHLCKLTISKFTKHYYKAIDLWITDMMQTDITVDLIVHIEEDNQNQQTCESKTYDSLSDLSLSLVCMQLEHLEHMRQMQNYL